MMLLRLWRYLLVMFPPHIHVPAGLTVFWAPYLLGMALAGQKASFASPAAWCGAASTVLFMLLLRVMDELKDYETDKRLFKQRPLVTGVVELADVRFLLVFLSGLLVMLNLWWGAAVGGAFLVVFVYAFLMLKYFFYPAISQSLVLAVVTHNPIAALVALYSQSFVVRQFGMGAFEWHHVLVVLLFWLPFLAWELARKVRSPAGETDYVTYTKLFGVPLTLGVLFAVCCVIVGLEGFLLHRAGLSRWPFYVSCAVVLGLAVRFLSFLREPWEVPTGFRNDLEFLMTCLNVGAIIAAWP